MKSIALLAGAALLAATAPAAAQMRAGAIETVEHRARVARLVVGAQDRLAAFGEGGIGGRLVVIAPAVERAPLDRLELRIADRQRARLLGQRCRRHETKR